MINPINTSNISTISTIPKLAEKENAKVDANSVTKKNDDIGATLEIGSKVEKPITYSNIKTVKPDFVKIEQLQKQTDESLAPLRRMVEELLTKQGLTFNKANESSSSDELVEITPEIRAEAQSLVAEGGAYSVENTSTRLVDFAKAISGGDKSQIDELRKNINKGYEEARIAFGGELPEISKKTLEMTMKKLDEWQNS